MRVIRGQHNIRADDRGCVVTIGNFDGVHLGHQAILAAVKAKAVGSNADSMLICFEPQPKEFFDEFQAPARLTRFREKVEQLSQFGVDRILCMKFDEATRSMSGQAFVQFLVESLAPAAVYVGDDFRFGSDRSGGIDALRQAGKLHGFSVENFYTITEGAERVSSTRIRACLKVGDFNEAKALLGRAYTISGRVVYGRQIGRTLGVPTANIQLHRYTAPLSGVYAVRGKVLDQVLEGVANVGVRPTLEDGALKPILEVHFFGLGREIYGEKVEIEFIEKIRDEQKFESLDALKTAIFSDIERARQVFAE